MAERHVLLCQKCGYEAEVYTGYGFFKQHIESVVCEDCHKAGNLVVGGVISQVAPSFDSLVGRLCPHCSSANIRLWNKQQCPKCGGLMKENGEADFWA